MKRKGERADEVLCVVCLAPEMRAAQMCVFLLIRLTYSRHQPHSTHHLPSYFTPRHGSPDIRCMSLPQHIHAHSDTHTHTHTHTRTRTHARARAHMHTHTHTHTHN